MLAEYRERLAEARSQADEIVTRARQAGDAHQKEAVEAARAERERLIEQTRRDVECRDPPGDRRDPSRGRRPDGDGDREGHPQDADRRRPASRLVEDALSELDFSALGGGEN